MTERKRNGDRRETPATYAHKTASYFEGEGRADYVSALPACAKVLEVGCGSGATGAMALSSGRASSYYGVEINEIAGTTAAARLSEVIVGDIEEIDLPWEAASFDALILSEVLEHLRDPWSTVARIRDLLKPGGVVFASSPNVAHQFVIRMLIAGDFRLDSDGPMDATHLRWFTPSSFAELFTKAGLIVDVVQPLPPLTPRQRSLGRLTRRGHLVWYRIDLRAHAPL